MAKTASIGLRFEPELKNAIEAAAKDDRRSVAGLIEIVMAGWLTERGYWPPEKAKGRTKKPKEPR